MSESAETGQKMHQAQYVETLWFETLGRGYGWLGRGNALMWFDVNKVNPADLARILESREQQWIPVNGDPARAVGRIEPRWPNLYAK